MADSAADTKATSRKRKSKSKRRSLAVLAGYSPGTLPVLDNTTSTRKLVDNGDSGNAIRAMDDLAAIPVREALQSVYRIDRDKTLRDLCLFAFMLVLYAFITTNVLDVHEAWSTDAAVSDLLLDEEFGGVYRKNFYEIMTQGEFWQWLEGPLINGLYPEEWYNGRPFTEGEQGYVLEYLRLVGGVQIRQLRMPNNSCLERRVLDECVLRDGVCEGRYDTKGGVCYAEFIESRQTTAPFGPNGKYTWRDGLAPLEGLFGFGYDYGTGGYVTELPVNRTEAVAMVKQMKADKWTDASTRVVAIDLNLYNTNTKLLTVVRIVFEFDFTANVIVFAKTYTIKLVVYGWKGSTIYDWTDVLRTAMEAMYLGMVAFVFQKEARRMYWAKPINYFSKVKNLAEVALLVINLVLLAAWLRVLLDDRRNEFSVNETSFVDMFTLAERYVGAFTIAGGLGLLYSLKLFRYLSINKQMATMWTTLHRASTDLAAFLLGFVVITLGFAIFGQYSFGYLLKDFHNLPSSFSTVLRFSLGDFAYDELALARPRLAGIYFSMYVAIVFFVMVNIIIGIITKFFQEVHEETKTADRWKEGAKSFESDLWRRSRRVMLKCCSAVGRCNRKTMDEEERQVHEKMQHDQTEGSLREAEFLWQLRMCMRLSKRVSRVNLAEHLNSIYRNSKGKNMYIGVHELCQLTSKPPCAANEHINCDAAQLVHCYVAMKEVSILGESEEHQSNVVNAAEMNRYKIMKLNKYGIKQKRVVAIDGVAKELYNFDRHLRVRKKLPLEQLVQIDQDRTDPRRLDLQFTSDTTHSPSIQAIHDIGAKKQAIAARSDLETRYQLLFANRRSRTEFLAELLAALGVGSDKDLTSAYNASSDAISGANAAVVGSRRAAAKLMQAKRRRETASTVGPGVGVELVATNKGPTSTQL